MKKLESAEALEERLESLGAAVKEDHDLLDLPNNWSRSFGFDLFGRLPDLHWEFVMREFPPLIAAAVEFGRPARFTHGRAIWNMIDPARIEDRFNDDARRFVDNLKQLLLDDDWRKEMEGRSDHERIMKEYATAFERFFELGAMLGNHLPQLETELTDHGLSGDEFRKLKKLVGEQSRPAAKREGGKPKALFPAPKGGKYPAFDDEQFVQYLEELKSSHASGLEALTAYGGIPLAETAVERLFEDLADFDYPAACATLGAQKRRPPEGRGVDEFYETLAGLPELVAKNIDEHSAGEIDERIDECLDLLKRDDELARNEGFAGLRRLHRLFNWLVVAIPGIPSSSLEAARERLAREFEPRWAAVSGGPAHDRHLGRIVFTSKSALPQLDDKLPDAINPVEDPLYAHVFLDRPLNAIATGMLFFEAGDDRFVMQINDFPNKDTAYMRLDVLPDANAGRNPDLIRFFGRALESASDGLDVGISPAGGNIAEGRLGLKLTKADAGKLAKHVEKIAVAAEENRTRDAVLPEIFTRPFKGYKDKALALDKLVAAIEEAWKRNTHGEKIKVRALRVNHYKGPGTEWREEFNPRKEPIQRLTDSFVGIVYDTADGKTCCVEDGIQFRQFHVRGEMGYSADLDVLFWGLKPFALPPEQVKRIKG